MRAAKCISATGQGDRSAGILGRPAPGAVQAGTNSMWVSSKGWETALGGRRVLLEIYAEYL